MGSCACPCCACVVEEAVILNKTKMFSRHAIQTVRNFNTTSLRRSGMFPDPKKPDPAHIKTVDFWKKASFIVGLPACIMLAVNAYMVEKNHWSHPREDFIHYEYRAVRNKKFPFGDGNHSLFHNSYTNPIPQGYEKDWFVAEHDH